MVTNLPAEARAKWLKVMEARTPEEKLKALQEFLSAVPKHKGTERLVKQVRRRIAELRREIEERRRRRVGRGPRFFVEKEGAAQIVMLGPTNSGKSSLLRALTNAKPLVSPYPYTTKMPVPGMLPFEDIQFQLVEAPSLIEGAADGVAWGLKTIGLARNADALMIVVSLEGDPIEEFEMVRRELEKARILMVKPRGRVEIARVRGVRGIRVMLFGKLSGCTVDDVRRLLQSYRIHGAIVKVYGEATLDDVEEAIFEYTVYKPSIVVANKLDLPGADRRLKELIDHVAGRAPVIGVSARSGVGLDQIGPTIFKLLNIIRVYTKQPNDDKPSPKPLILKRGATVIDVAKAIHSALVERFKYARIWGPSAKYPGERVGIDHVLEDGDIVEIHAK